MESKINFPIQKFDDRRNLLIPGDENSTLDISARYFISICKGSIKKRGKFCVALAGGSTPKALYERLTSSPFKEQIEWDKVWLFWGDERSVPPDSDESNFKMAMKTGFELMPIPKNHIFRMQAETLIEQNALEYEKILVATLNNKSFDLILLGMGEDGHTASLFPNTEGLKAKNRLVIANYVPQKNTWRMTLTFEAINNANNCAILIIGPSKKEVIKEVLTKKENLYPIQNIGTKEHPVLWIVDDAASALLT